MNDPTRPDPDLDALRAARLQELQARAAPAAAPAPDLAPRPAGVLEATDASIARVIAHQALVAVDAYATWCGPCKVFAPTFARAAQAHPRVAFVKVDVDRNPRFAAQHQIQSIPTLLLFAHGTLVGRIAGALRPDGLSDVLGQLEALEATA